MADLKAEDRNQNGELRYDEPVEFREQDPVTLRRKVANEFNTSALDWAIDQD